MLKIMKLAVALIALNLRPAHWRSYSELLVTLLFMAGLSGCGGAGSGTSLASSSVMSSNTSSSSSQPATTTSSSSTISLETSTSSVATSSVMSSPATSSASSSLLNYTIAISAGDDQTGLINTALSDAISVKVTDVAGAAVANTKVNFSILSGTGSVTPVSATTNAAGVASANVTLGSTAGALHINASPEGVNSTVRFRMTAVEPDATASKSASEFNSTWATASHTKVSPSYTEVFDQDAVKTLEITLTAAQWASVRADMTVVSGSDFGASTGMTGGGMNGGGEIPGGTPPEGQVPGGTTPGGTAPEGTVPEGTVPENQMPGGEMPGGGMVGGNGGGLDLVDGDPAYVPVTISYNNKQWKKVGFRLKGNSSLSSAWGQGNYKLPFRLKINEFEDLFSAVSGQRFYGFKDMSFSPGYSDASLIREKLGSDIFRAGGMPAARTAFYRVYIDFGEGKKYCGVYTLVEVIDDTMVKDQFGEDKGNIYKPESTFASFNEAEFEKKNNTKAPDFSDVISLITVLNSAERTTDAAAWRSHLEAVFNVDHFLKWLAINNAIVSWDSYGSMAHNYYLYSHSQTKLTWIPWDLNMSLTGSPGVEGSAVTGGQTGGMGQGLSLSMNEVTSNWPLIRYLADDAVYFAKYKTYLKAFNQGAFNQTTIDALIDKYYGLITPYVIGENGEQAGYTYTTETTFTAGQQELKTHIQNRKALISGYLPE